MRKIEIMYQDILDGLGKIFLSLMGPFFCSFPKEKIQLSLSIRKMESL
jgi:hypothetical protein